MIQEQRYYISGMHCSACEIVIEKKLLKQDGIKAVDVSLSNQEVRIEYEEHQPSLKELNKLFEKDGYTLSEEPIQEKKEPLLYVEDGKGIQLNRKRVKQMRRNIVRIVLVFLVLYLLERSGAAAYINVSEQSSLVVFFAFGIVAGLSSCAALVGGILLSMTARWQAQIPSTAFWQEKLRPHLRFHACRIVAYMLFGALLGAIGHVIAFDDIRLYAALTILVSIVMLIIGCQMLGMRWAQKIELRLPKQFTRKIAKDDHESKRLPGIIGALTVLLPCGFTLIAQGVALTSGSIVRGALIMGFFVLGTMLPLLAIGWLSNYGSKNLKRKQAFSFYAGVVLVIFAIYNINGQFNVLGWPSLSDLRSPNLTAAPAQQTDPTNKPAQQEVRLLAQGFQYQLQSAATIHAGVPTTLVVDDQGMQGCGIFIAARGLFDGFVALEPGENRIDLGRPQPGNYKITCSMGMVPPVTLTVQ